jgi:hypothetical protein
MRLQMEKLQENAINKKAWCEKKKIEGYVTF